MHIIGCSFASMSRFGFIMAFKCRTVTQTRFFTNLFPSQLLRLLSVISVNDRRSYHNFELTGWGNNGQRVFQNCICFINAIKRVLIYPTFTKPKLHFAQEALKHDHGELAWIVYIFILSNKSGKFPENFLVTLNGWTQIDITPRVCTVSLVV